MVVRVELTRRHAPALAAIDGAALVGVVANGVGAEAGENRGGLIGGDDVTGRGTTKVGVSARTLKPQTDHANRHGRRARAEGDLAVQTEVHVHRSISIELQEQVLAEGLGRENSRAIEKCGRLSEPTLGAADPHRASGEGLIELVGESVQDVSLGHVRPAAE